MEYKLSDKVCEYCKEDKNRDTKYLVELPITTQNLHLKVLACPHCDGPPNDPESLLRMSYTPR